MARMTLGQGGPEIFRYDPPAQFLRAEVGRQRNEYGSGTVILRLLGNLRGEGYRHCTVELRPDEARDLAALLVAAARAEEG